jgi:ketosteroid isomerase-like protein
MTRKLLLIAIVVCMAFSLAIAQEADKRMGPRRKAPATSGTPAENEVRQVEHDWAQAYVNHDVAALENILGNEWTYCPGDGGFKTRGQALDDFRVDTMKYESVLQLNLIVRVYGTTAVVTGEEVIKGSDGGKAITVHIRFTDVLVKRDDRWQAVASHESNIPEAPPDPQ